MTRRALTAILTGAAYVLGYQTARLWLGRCATECRRGRLGAGGPVSVDPPAVSGAETGAERLPSELDAAVLAEVGRRERGDLWPTVNMLSGALTLNPARTYESLSRLARAGLVMTRCTDGSWSYGLSPRAERMGVGS